MIYQANSISEIRSYCPQNPFFLKQDCYFDSVNINPVDGAAYTSLVFAINSLNMKGRVGRPQSNLFSLIKHDLNERKLFLNNINDLNYLRNIARASWRRMQ